MVTPYRKVPPMNTDNIASSKNIFFKTDDKSEKKCKCHLLCPFPSSMVTLYRKVPSMKTDKTASSRSIFFITDEKSVKNQII